MDGQNPQPAATTVIGADTRDVIRAEVARRMAGSPEPVPLYYIECRCLDDQGNLPDRGKHGYLGEGDFCAKHIRAAVKAQKFGPKDFRGPIHCPEESDSISTCATCGCAIVCSPTADCIETELDHWTDNPGHPSTAKEWREFSLCLNDIERSVHVPTEEAEWGRIVAIMVRETPWVPWSVKRTWSRVIFIPGDGYQTDSEVCDSGFQDKQWKAIRYMTPKLARQARDEFRAAKADVRVVRLRPNISRSLP